jgi:hypothetical protein
MYAEKQISKQWPLSFLITTMIIASIQTLQNFVLVHYTLQMVSHAAARSAVTNQAVPPSHPTLPKLAVILSTRNDRTFTNTTARINNGFAYAAL